MAQDQIETPEAAPATGDTPIKDLDQCVCSGKSLGRLLRPALLAMLAQAPSHGYDLAQKIAERDLFAADPPDPSGVYKTLKEMEREGLIASSWELADSGPAKRRYELSAEGVVCLQRWISTLQTYRSHIDGILSLLAPKRQSGLPVMQSCACKCDESGGCCC